MNFKAFNKDIEISAVVKSVSDVKDLFRAYNIQIEEEENVEDEGPIIEPIIEMTCDDSEDDSDHDAGKIQLPREKEELEDDGCTS